MQSPTNKTLTNQFVTLSPISPIEAAAYFEIGREPAIWDFLSPEPFQTRKDAEAWIDMMLDRSKRSGDITFSVYEHATNKLAGSTSYLDVRTAHRGLEIGFTWYGSAFRRTRVNTATKLLLLGEAFDTLGAIRVQFQTDSRNHNSQRAIERLGATKEGLLRKHKVYPTGYVRDTVLYSITHDEWSQVKDVLEESLEL